MFFCMYNEMSQYLVGLYNTVSQYFQMSNILPNHAWVKKVNIQDKPMDFNVTEYIKLIKTSDCT